MGALLFNCQVVTVSVRRHSQLHSFDVSVLRLEDGRPSLFLKVKGDTEITITGFVEAPLPALPAISRGLMHEIAIQLRGIANRQCEATQWLTVPDRKLLRRFFHTHFTQGGFYRSEAATMVDGGLWRSISRAIEEGAYDGWNGVLWLHPVVYNLVLGMLERAEGVHNDAIQRGECRPPLPIPESPEKQQLLEEKVRYDPSTGVAYNFTESGRRRHLWPSFKVKSERACACKKPDWLRSPRKSLSEGVLTFMCVRSGVVVGNTFLTGHEGQKDAGSALYCYHHLVSLESVVCDTPCMHATYMNTRAGGIFGKVKMTGDRFHITPHTCADIYNPDEYATYDAVNSSMIEQWHAIVDPLTRTVKGSKLTHAMFLVQTLQDDHYLAICKRNHYPENAQRW